MQLFSGVINNLLDNKHSAQHHALTIFAPKASAIQVIQIAVIILACYVLEIFENISHNLMTVNGNENSA